MILLVKKSWVEDVNSDRSMHFVSLMIQSGTICSQKSIVFLLNPFRIKLVTIHFSACNFASVHLYKEITFKPIWHIYECILVFVLVFLSMNRSVPS